MRPPRVRLLPITFVGLAACGGGSPATATGTHTQQHTHHLSELGVHASPLLVKGELVYTNGTAVEQHVASVQSSCSCFRPRVRGALPAVVGPGARLVIDYAIDAPQVEGRFKYSASLQDRSGRLVHVESLLGTVVGVAHCMPPGLTADLQAAVSATLLVPAGLGPPELIAAPDWVTVRFVPLEPGVWRVECVFSAPRRSQGELMVSLGANAESDLHIPVRAAPAHRVGNSPLLVVRRPDSGSVQLSVPATLMATDLAPGIRVVNNARGSFLDVDAGVQPGVQRLEAAVSGSVPDEQYVILLVVTS